MRRVAILLAAMVCLAPLWFLGVGSLLKASTLFLMPPTLFPRMPTLDNYAWAFRLDGWVQWAGNTGIVVLLTVLGSVSVSCMAGYAFSFFRFPFKKTIWALLLMGMMVPRIALLIPLFVVSSRIGISGTLWAVILPGLLSPVGMWLARTYFDTVPRSIVESARIDGAGDWMMLARVVAPLSRPIVTALGLFAAIGALQDWVWQALQLQESSTQTLLVGWLRATMTTSGSSNLANPIGHSMAAGMLLLIPLLAVFIVANKYFVGSLEGAVKE